MRADFHLSYPAESRPNLLTRNRVRTNTLANLLGYGWATALQLVLAPFYIRYLGIEGYALIGFYLMLIASVQIFDFGLSQTVNRELARLSADPQASAKARDVLRTLEFVYWPVVGVVCLLMLLSTPFLVRNFLNASAVPPQVLQSSVSTMALIIAMQWPVTFYSSGLMGLQRQVLANGLRIALSTITGVGAILVVSRANAPLLAFFHWQALCAALALACYCIALYRILPAAEHKARFRPEILRGVWRFATGITAITLSALILTQFDKWILAETLPLAAFGYFMLAVTVAGALTLLVTPVFNAVFPRFSGLAAREEHETLFNLYHLATQAMAAFLLPVALVLSLFAAEILYVWMGDADVARHSGPLLAVLVLGTALNGLFHVPYAWALARGQTRFIAVMNFAAIVVLVPLVWYFAGRYGAIVAAVAWLLLNLAYLVVFVPVVHRQLPRKDRSQWLLRDIGIPLALSVLVVGFARVLLPEGLGRLAMAGSIGLVLFVALGLTIGMSPGVRGVAGEILARGRAAAPENFR
jgi:O-antigen/teichoic acid export membrane protein